MSLVDKYILEWLQVSTACTVSLPPCSSERTPGFSQPCKHQKDWLKFVSRLVWNNNKNKKNFKTVNDTAAWLMFDSSDAHWASHWTDSSQHPYEKTLDILVTIVGRAWLHIPSDPAARVERWLFSCRLPAPQNRNRIIKCREWPKQSRPFLFCDVDFQDLTHSETFFFSCPGCNKKCSHPFEQCKMMKIHILYQYNIKNQSGQVFVKTPPFAGTEHDELNVPFITS